MFGAEPFEPGERLDGTCRRREHRKTGKPCRKTALPFSPRPNSEARLIAQFLLRSSEKAADQAKGRAWQDFGARKRRIMI